MNATFLSIKKNPIGLNYCEVLFIYNKHYPITGRAGGDEPSVFLIFFFVYAQAIMFKISLKFCDNFFDKWFLSFFNSLKWAIAVANEFKLVMKDFRNYFSSSQ